MAASYIPHVTLAVRRPTPIGAEYKVLVAGQTSIMLASDFNDLRSSEDATAAAADDGSNY